MKKFNFQTACANMLIDLGAALYTSDSRLVLQTIAGPMKCQAYDNWLHCQFDDVELAKKEIGFGTLNPYSGKWNWHYNNPTQADLNDLRELIQSILKEPS